jgi:hypothetical protein
MTIDTDAIILAIVLVVVMFAGMRLIYGYWPWQTGPKIIVPKVTEDEISVWRKEWNNPILPKLEIINSGEDHFDRDFIANNDSPQTKGEDHAG